MIRRILIACGVLLALGDVTPALAQLAAAEPEWYLRPPGGCRLFVQEYGTGRDTVVVLHGGWGAEHSYLLDAFAGLDRRFHFVFYDQRGSLRSPCPDSLISVDRHVEDLELLRRALRLDRMTIAAHSMGTVLAMSYLARFPDAPRGIVLLGALPPRTPVTPADTQVVVRQGEAVRSFFKRPAIAAQLRAAGLDRDTAALTPKDRTTIWRIQFAGVNTFHVDRWRAVKGGQAFYDPRAAQAASRSMPDQYDFTPMLLRHPCSVTVILGDHDFADMGGLQHASWTAGAPRAKLVLLRDAGHSAWVDQPARFGAALDAALIAASRCR